MATKSIFYCRLFHSCHSLWKRKNMVVTRPEWFFLTWFNMCDFCRNPDPQVLQVKGISPVCSIRWVRKLFRLLKSQVWSLTLFLSFHLCQKTRWRDTWQCSYFYTLRKVRKQDLGHRCLDLNHKQIRDFSPKKNKIKTAKDIENTWFEFCPALSSPPSPCRTLDKCCLRSNGQPCACKTGRKE